MSAWHTFGAGILVAYLVHVCMRQAARLRTTPDPLAALARVVAKTTPDTPPAPAAGPPPGVSPAGRRNRSTAGRRPASHDSGAA